MTGHPMVAEGNHMAASVTERAKDRDGDNCMLYLSTVLRHWKLCFVGPLVLAVAAYLVLIPVPRWYRAEAVVTSAAVDFGEGEISIAAQPTAGLVAFFQDGELIKNVISSLGLDKPPYQFSVDDFMRSLLEVAAPRDTNLIRVMVSLPNADLAGQAANMLASNARDKVTQELQEQLKDMVTVLESEVTTAQTTFLEAENKLREFEKTAKLELLRGNVTAQRELLQKSQRRRAELEAMVASASGSIKSYEASLENEPRLIEVKQYLSKSPVLQQALATRSSVDVEQLLDLSLEETVLNPLYMGAGQSLVDQKSREQSLSAELKSTNETLGKAQNELPGLEEQLADSEGQLRILQNARDHAQRALASSVDKLQSIKNVVTWRPQVLSLVPATTPIDPFWPRKSLVALAVFVLSFVIFSGGSLVRASGLLSVGSKE